MKKRVPLTSIFIVFVLLVQLFSCYAFAETEAEAETPEYTEEAYKPTVIGEVAELRQANIKYFASDDQTVTACIYPYNVHYQDAAGAWRDIDNRLTEQTTRGETELVNAAGEIGLRFAKTATDSRLATVTVNGHTVSWALDGARETFARAEKETAAEDVFFVENTSCSVSYPNILDGVDVEYTAIGSELKENLILKNQNTPRVFSFLYRTGALTMEEQDNKLSLFDGAERVLTLSAPVMTDAAYETSDRIDLTAELVTDAANDHIYRVTVTPDQKWLDDASRAFPVVIDPDVSTEQDRNHIYDTYVASNAAGTNYSSAQTLKVGMNGSSAAYRTLLKFDLPDAIGPSDRVVGAVLRLAPSTTAADLTTMAAQRPVIEAHRITSTWDKTAVTWNNQPSFNTQIEDYDIIETPIPNNLDNFRYTWDITDMVDDWYTTGTNNGVLLKYNSETAYGSNMVLNCYATRGNDSTAYPIIQITYMNMLGLEDYWTYHSIDAGNAGTAYINDFTGGMTLVTPLCGLSGNRSPLSVSHIYSPGSFDGSIYGTKVGNGYMLNIQCSVKSDPIGNTQRYKYVDSDGTIHYFNLDSGTTWKDDSGLGLTLMTGDQTFNIIKDKKDNKLFFYKQGRFCKSEDSVGNTTTVYYTVSGSDYLLQKIVDGAGRVALAEHDSSNRLTRLYYPDDGDDASATTIASKGRFAQIMYTANKSNIYHVSQYVKDQDDTPQLQHYAGFTVSNNVLTGIIDAESNKAITFSYNISEQILGRFRRVQNYKSRQFLPATSAFGETECEVNITYGDRSTKYATTSGGVSRSELYTFNRFGQTVTAQDQSGNAVYQAQGMSGGSKNKVTFASGTQHMVTNLLLNSGFEQSASTTSITNWARYMQTGDNIVAKGTADSEPTLFGNMAMKMYKKSASVTANLTAQQVVSLAGGKIYTLSAYVRTDFDSVPSNVDYGAIIGLQNGDYTVTSMKKGIVSQGEFTRHSTTIDLTGQSGSVNFNIYVGLSRVKGVAYFDAIQLEEGGSVNSYNLVQNAGFETSAQTSLWTRQNLGDTDGVITSTKHTGTSGFKIVGNPKVRKMLYQTIAVNGKKGDGLTAGVWVKCATVPNKDTEQTGDYQTCSLMIEICRSSGSSTYYTAALDLANDEWRYLCVGGLAKFAYTDVKIYLKYPYNYNNCYFDDFCLFKDVFGQSYVYDENGNISSVVDKANNTKTIVANGNNDITSYKDGAGNTYNFEYDNGSTTAKKHLLTKVTNPDGSKVTNTYDAYGNVTTSATSNSSNSLRVSSTTLYSEDGNLADRVATENGHYVYYDNDAATGTTKKVINYLGGDDCSVAMWYGYDSVSKRLKTVMAAQEFFTPVNGRFVQGLSYPLATEVNYDYNSEGYLSGIRRMDVSSPGTPVKTTGYHMEYDIFGNRTAVKWSGKNNTKYTLQTTTYNTGLGLPTSTTYGNGQTVGFQYDATGRTTGVTYNGSKIRGFDYNAAGSVGRSWYMEGASKVATSYFYDLAGRVTDHTNTLGTSAEKITYNKNNMVTSYVTRQRDSKVKTAWTMLNTYNNMSRPTKLQFEATSGAPSGTINFSYDGIGRASTKAVSLSASDNLTTSYSYKPNGNETTPLVSGVSVAGSYNGTSLSLAYGYTYDPLDNITQETETENNTTTTRQYTYDLLSQLTGVTTTGGSPSTETFSYDNSGNLTEKVKTASGVTVTDTYGYDSNMTDVLTSFTRVTSEGGIDSTEVREYNYANNVYFNPTSIVYKDENDVTLSTRTFSWREGRKLESVTIDGSTYGYYYDENGLRVLKTLPGGGKVRYIYNGGSLDSVIMYASGGSVTCYLKYLYNASGELEYILRKKDNLSDPTKYDLFTVVYNGKGEITKLVQTRKQTSTGVGFQFRVVANYTYDAYGSVTVSSPVSGEDIGVVNPLRYKNYIYDAETDWYYLQTRYYDPAVGRFLNADGYADSGEDILGTNMFANCANNPINRLDVSGTRWDDQPDYWRYYDKEGNKKKDAVICLGKTSNNNYVYISRNLSSNYSTPMNAIKAVDLRNDAKNGNANIQIRDSYKVYSVIEREEVAIFLIKYNEENPSDPAWERSLDSILVEWDAHNDTYELKPNSRSQHVDLDNNDEGVSYLAFWKRAIKSQLGW